MPNRTAGAVAMLRPTNTPASASTPAPMAMAPMPIRRPFMGDCNTVDATNVTSHLRGGPERFEGRFGCAEGDRSHVEITTDDASDAHLLEEVDEVRTEFGSDVCVKAVDEDFPA